VWDCNLYWGFELRAQASELKGAIYDPSTGACYGGLLPDGVNLNQAPDRLSPTY